ncbi:unnamed protein product [Vitrella brassicaformis CCMP3155]|uniref:Cyclin-dependent kinases regulatory subunit n=1 Tax=Vitrella brassicaformis (strain CCMP3155) TaxID=1169540 RepID=A0A0G4FZY2_VITBC|nr:unnamed protein product [Vitrella brassicaformis CCMP3155]|mmetsp:Transcript_53303/g.134226  ORF Transcript_53303/g.134226 Transcript_53303/m.134226 type:complete len:116 (-) Transcript_53303:571-918(-)|eukprot:CEM21193.1 unnamed protein product [Vitrella brassicaformis CCMP3155]
MVHYPQETEYSEKYSDGTYEYRHVILNKQKARQYAKIQAESGQPLLTEPQWRSLGVTQSRGWIHYEVYKPEPHILLFRRALDSSNSAAAKAKAAPAPRMGPLSQNSSQHSHSPAY